jgi:hypothetical protein
MHSRVRILAGLVLIVGLFACGRVSDSPGPRSDARSGESQAAPSRPSGSPDLTSGLNVPGGQRFIFAGGQRSGFTAFATNRGSVPVTIAAELDGERREIVTIAPGEKASYEFAPREAALFENPSSQDAAVKVEVWGETSVGMRYVKLAK